MTESRLLTKDEYEAVRSGKKAIYVHGEVKYRDAFRTRQFVRFRFFNQLWPNRVNTLDVDEEGFDAS